MAVKSVTITLSESIYEQLNASAEEMGLSRSGYVTLALKRCFESEKLLKSTPDILTGINLISKKLDEMKGKDEE